MRVPGQEDGRGRSISLTLCFRCGSLCQALWGTEERRWPRNLVFSSRVSGVHMERDVVLHPESWEALPQPARHKGPGGAGKKSMHNVHMTQGGGNMPRIRKNFCFLEKNLNNGKITGCGGVCL